MTGTEAFWIPAVTSLVAGGAGYAASKKMAPKPAEMPKLPEAVPLPIEDDATRRQARMRELAKLSSTSGRQSTMLTSDKLGGSDSLGASDKPETRSTVLQMG